jgi:hypothetical protein
MFAIIRKILFSLTALLLAFEASAQSEVTKAINDIKRSPSYFYAEATMPDEAQARDAANVMLAQFINDYVKENSISGVARVTSSNLKSVEYKSMARGTQIRVFAYVHRSVYLPNYSAPTSAGQTNVAKSTSTTVSEKTVAAETKAAGTKTSGMKAVGTRDSETKNVAQKPAVTVVSGELSLIGRRTVGELLAAADLPSAVKQLAKLQSENIVKRYGTIRDCRDAAGSCWIIAQSNSSMEIVTILGPGSDTRTNFKTDSDDSLANYSGYNAVWFELN